MSAPGWRTSLVVQGVDLHGRSVPVVVGIIETAAGALQLAMRVGEAEPVILPLQAASLLRVNLGEMLEERLRETGEGLS